MPQIEVTFDIDANGIVHVSAKDQGTGKEQSMTISGGSALSKEEIERMVKDAEAHAEEDKERREETEARNTAEQLVYSTEKFLADNGDKVPADGRDAGRRGARRPQGRHQARLGRDHATTSRPRSTTLNTKSQKMGAAMYAAAAERGRVRRRAGRRVAPTVASRRPTPVTTTSSTPRSSTTTRRGKK